jgi:hypothetical protein
MNAKNRHKILRSLAAIKGHCARIKKEIDDHIERCTDEKSIAEDNKDKAAIDELEKIIGALRAEGLEQHLYSCAEMLLEITVRNYSVIFKHIPYARKSRGRIIDLLKTLHYSMSCSIE